MMQVPTVTRSFEQADRALQQLDVALRKRVVVSAARAAANVIKNEAKRRAPVRTGRLRMSIGISRVKEDKAPPGTVQFLVLPKSTITVRRTIRVDGEKTRTKFKLRSYHGLLLEFGTVKMEARPYLRPAAEATTSEVTRAFIDKIHDGVEKQLAKTRR